MSDRRGHSSRQPEVKKENRAMEVLILAVAFVVAVLVFSYFTNQDTEDMTADMGSATFPQITCSYQGYALNCLSGYAQEMDIPSMRETIMPVTDGEITFSLNTYDAEVTSLDYQVYTLDGETVLSQGSQDNPGETFQLTFTDASFLAEESVLVMTLHVADVGAIYYYTRMIDAADKNLLTCLDFIYQFYQGALEKSTDAGVGNVLETGVSGADSSFGHVTIYSSYDQVTWGDLEPQVDGNVRWNITEMNSVYTSVQLEYLVDCRGEENETDEYKVQEFFRVRYRSDKDRTYLLDYDRKMEQVLDSTQTLLGETGILLGVYGEDVSYMTNEKGTIVSFIQADELWCYNKEQNEISRVFSFISSEGKDLRDLTSHHELRLLSMDQDGDTTFAVCGYMNRGEHEGEVGIAIYYFDREVGTVTEKAFVSTDRSYGYAICEMGKLLYYSEDTDDLYMLMNGTLYEIQVDNGKKTELVQGLEERPYVISEDGSKIAYQTVQGQQQITTIVVKDFASGAELTITSEADEELIPLGFLDDDFAYGRARTSDAGQTASGEDILPMYQVEIQNAAGDVMKTYQEEQIYILDAEVNEQMIALDRAVKKGTTYQETTEEYIMSNEEQEESLVSVETYITDLKETQQRLVFQDGISDRGPKVLQPQQVMEEVPESIPYEDLEGQESYSVYGYGELQGIYEDAGEAIVVADSYDGVVVSRSQAYVWQRGYRDLNFELSVNDSGVQATVQALKAGTSPLQIMEDLGEGEVLDLTGCTTEETLYVLNQGYPVIAMKDANHAIILLGYSENLVLYLDPNTEELSRGSYATIDKMTAKSGHTYVGKMAP